MEKLTELVEKIDMQLKIDLQVTKGGALRKYTDIKTLTKEDNHKEFIRGSAKTTDTPRNLYTASAGEMEEFKVREFVANCLPRFANAVLPYDQWSKMAISKVADFTEAFAQAMDCAEDVTIVNAINSSADIVKYDLTGNDITASDVWRKLVQTIALARSVNSSKIQMAGGAKASLWMHVLDYSALVSVDQFMNADYSSTLTIDNLITNTIGGIPVETFDNYDIEQAGATVAVEEGTAYVVTNGAVVFVHRPDSANSESKFDGAKEHSILISMSKEMGAKVRYPKKIWKLSFDKQPVA